jgi:hypothetical protein
MKRFSVGQIVGALKQAEFGVPVVVVIREAGISKQAFYPWKAKHIVSQWKRRLWAFSQQVSRIGDSRF